MKVAVVGSGISGLAAAHRLREHAHVTLFEANDYFGGHTHTVDITLPTPQGMTTWGVDTGFLVYNERTYPNLIALFAELGVVTAPTDMSFSVQVPSAQGGHAIEWSGTNLATVFAQKRNLVNPRFWGMLSDLLRFNRLCTQLALNQQDARMNQPLQAFLEEHRFGQAFRDWYFLPMLGCIWSCPTHQMLEFPVATLIRFCHNHGLLQVENRPLWFTVVGGSRNYVNAIAQELDDVRLSCPVLRIERDATGVTLHTAHGKERFDQVVIAAHADQALAMLGDPSETESRLLGAIRFERNRAVLHTDVTLMPRAKKAWAAWNYERAGVDRDASSVCLHYWLNRLQPLPFTSDVFVSLNPIRQPAPNLVLAEIDYEHPIFDVHAIQAQSQLHWLKSQPRTHFAGAWMGYGFHEDGLQSGLQAADAVLQALRRNWAIAAA